MSDRVSARVSENGDSVFSVRVDAGGIAFVGDEPVAMGGGGLGPNPYELLSAALAECTAMTIRWYARQQGWPVEHVAVEVTHEKGPIEGQARPGDIFHKTVAIRGDALNEEQRRRLIDVAAKCPVHRTLEATPVITTSAAETVDG
ncbi:OsmC family protein [Sphingomonas flavalba]|uniref:OsmC family protein n=1 Tax=Sphingomonas flavalba TaxID=2559804 RepID=UPI0039E0ADD7